MLGGIGLQDIVMKCFGYYQKMKEFKLSFIPLDSSWYIREKTMDAVIRKLKHWTKILDPTGKTYKNELAKVEAWRKLHLMKIMILRANGFTIFPSKYAGPMPK